MKRAIGYRLHFHYLSVSLFSDSHHLLYVWKEGCSLSIWLCLCLVSICLRGSYFNSFCCYAPFTCACSMKTRSQDSREKLVY